MTVAQGQTLAHIAKGLQDLAETHAVSRYDRTVEGQEPYEPDDSYVGRMLTIAVRELGVLAQDIAVARC